MPDLAIVYYSANTEDAAFEGRIRAHLTVAAAGRPILAVTQQPIDDLENLCVGPVGSCDANAFRQLLLGARAMDADWIAVAEADAIYPPSYFAFEPEAGRVPGAVHRYGEVWILGGRGPFRRKAWTEGAQVVWRETLIGALERALQDRPEWSTAADPKPPEVFKKRHWYTWGRADAPVVSCKTGNGLRAVCGTMRDVEPQPSLPHWGSAEACRAWLWDGAPAPMASG